MTPQEWGGPGSVRFGFGLGVESFERFRVRFLVRGPEKTWNGNIQTNVRTNISEECEGTAQENVGFETKRARNSSELRHEHCHGISLPYFLRSQLICLSVQFNVKEQFWFRSRFLETGPAVRFCFRLREKNGSDGFRFLVPARFLSHIARRISPIVARVAHAFSGVTNNIKAESSSVDLVHEAPLKIVKYAIVFCEDFSCLIF